MFDQLNDTIVAISSPVGMGVRGIVRLSGPRAFAIAASVFVCDDGESLLNKAGHSRHQGRVWVDGLNSVPGEAYVFRMPMSYTRQDVIELHTIGSPPVLGLLLRRLTSAGARLAEPGEFTARAYFSGALDLTRVEGVAAIIHACSDSQLRASEALLHGALSRRTTALRDRLADLLALIEAEIDFTEEPIEFISPPLVIQTVDEVLSELEEMIDRSPSVERLEWLPTVMLVGRPNVGKSTLFNQLTGFDRAIHSAVAGTTRDVISAPVRLSRGEIMLLDSAGLSYDECGATLSPGTSVDELAMEASLRSMVSADLILLVMDKDDDPTATVELMRGPVARGSVRYVLNKTDAISSEDHDRILAALKGSSEVISVSALTGAGIDTLRRTLDEALFSSVETHGSQLLALSDRHKQALRDGAEALVRVRKICDDCPETSAQAEIIALEVREAMNALSFLVGEVATEDLLSHIFSQFCIGK